MTTRIETHDLPAELQTRLELAVEKIVEIARPSQIILFGSFADGHNREGSDVDLVVVADAASSHQLAVAIRRAIRPILKPFSFDLLVFRPDIWNTDRQIPGFVARDADREGVRLYAAG